MISVVAPAFNEAETLPTFCSRVAAALDGEAFEIVVVNDGSTDGTDAVIARIAEDDPRVRSLSLSRNFGHQAAVTAGIDHAFGNAVITIDADLQDPPEVIPALLAEWRTGADIVHAVRHVRPGEPRLRLFGIRLFYRVFGRLSGLPSFPGNTGDFRLMSGPALEALRALPERNRFIRGLVSWVGYDQRNIYYEREQRHGGVSKYPLPKLIRLALDGIVAFSIAPLRFATAIGIVCSGGAFLAIPLVIVLRLAGMYSVTGIASIHIMILFIGGLQLIFLGVIGEYLGRTYDEGKRRPSYLLLNPTDSDGRVSE